MLPQRKDSIRLFQLAGIQVSMHWSWFLVAMYQISERKGSYGSLGWNVAEYLALFLIVLLHEFGHSLACRSVGGKAEDIILWPFGGVAYVSPPQRPGAMLWSIAAGPLVNVALVPLLIGLGRAADIAGWTAAWPDLGYLLYSVSYINLGLLIFNVLPVYPLDGGQILQALLWFWLGRARSLQIASIIGFFGVAGFVGLAVVERSLWMGALSLFALMWCWQGFQRARAELAFAKLPRHPLAACPACHKPPLAGASALCGKCGKPFDPFASAGVCPHCLTSYAGVRCRECGETRPIGEWLRLGPGSNDV